MATRVLIVGGGFAGAAAARKLESVGRKSDLVVTLVSRTNYLLFTPLLPEVAGGTIDARDITEPLRAMLRRTNVELGETVSIDLEDRSAVIESPITRERTTLHYDHVVLALGSIEKNSGIPGASEFGLPLKSMSDAVTLRNRVLGGFEVAVATRDRVERDRLLRFVVIGGGFTGVEAAGELLSFAHSVHRFYPALEAIDPVVELVENQERLLAHLPEKFGKRAAALLRDRGIALHVGVGVEYVDGAGVQLKNGKRLESRTVVWSAGVEPEPLVRTLGVRLSRHDAIVVNPDFSVPERRGVWAVGDCAAVPQPGGGYYVPLAQNAVREGPLLARNIVAAIRGRRTADFRYKPLGQMVSIGGRCGVAELPGRRMISGRLAWMLWRTYYLGRLPGWYRKARVAADWTLDAAFPTGTSRLALVAGEEHGEEINAIAR